MQEGRGWNIWVIIGFLIGVSAGILGITLFNQNQPAPIRIVPPGPTALPSPTPTPAPIRVYVNGQVAAPAVYTLPADSIVEEAILAAGGFTSEANTVVVNLAQPLRNGDQIYVPSQDENVPAFITIVSTPLPLEDRSNIGETIGSNELVNINTAGIDQLDGLPGIGPATANKILDYRQEHGLFKTKEEIMEVSGIGDAKFAQIKDLITVGEE